MGGLTFIITLVRHGETLANRQKIMQGQMNTLLSDLGMKQAQVVAKRLENEKFTHIFSSDLARAADTARAIVESNKYFSGSLVLDSKLRERGFGNLEGKCFVDYKQAAEDAHIPMHDFTPDGGETLAQVTDRATEFFSELCALMAEPLMGSSNMPSKDCNGTCSNHVAKCGSSSDSTDVWIQSADNKTKAHSSETLHVDIPNCCHDSGAKSDDTKRDSMSSSSRSASEVRDLHLSNSKQRSQCSVHLSLANVLIVSHGLLLRELKQLIIKKYEGKLLGNQVAEAGRICPNTGLSQFTMCVFISNNVVCVKCDQVHLISDTSHLASASEDLVTHVPNKFQGVW